MSLRVIQPGLYTLVVDRGRPRSRSLGVPVGGAADYFSFVIGNALVGNPPDAAALEINLSGPTLEAGCDLACVVHGAPFEVECDRQPLEAGKTFTLRAGERLRIGSCSRGMRAYFCVRGGIQTPVVLGSRSGLAPLSPGMELDCLPGVIGSRFVRLEEPLTADRIRVLPGPQSDWFPATALTDATYRVSPASNRMGLRLEGPPLPWPGREMVSEPVCPGTVQVTRDGQCIVLGVDGQTIGGYPKVAQVIAADLDLVAQLRPGDEITFTPVTMNEAEALFHQSHAMLHDWVVRLTAGDDPYVGAK